MFSDKLDNIVKFILIATLLSLPVFQQVVGWFIFIFVFTMMIVYIIELNVIESPINRIF